MLFPSAALAQSGSVLLLEPVENRIEQADILVFGGTKPAGGNWSSIFVVRLAGDGPLRSCTATKVGPSVLLTAAHCIDQGDDKPFRSLSLKPLPGSNDAVQFTCKPDDRYLKPFYRDDAPRAPIDYALCRLSKGGGPALNRFEQFSIERLDLSPLDEGAPVLLTGFGCVEMKVDLKKPERTRLPFVESFNIGDEKIHTVGVEIVTTRSDDAKEPALCDGDSGGPLFTGVSTNSPLAERDLRGVNSQVSVTTYELISTMAALGSAEFRQFLGCWKQDHAADVLRIRDANLVLPCVR